MKIIVIAKAENRRPPRLSDPSCSGWEPFFWAMAETESRFPGAALLVQGSVPARQKGWMCKCAVQLKFVGAKATCEACGEKYVLENGRVREA